MVKAIDNIPWIIKLILWIFFGVFLGALYRIFAGVEGRTSLLQVIVGIIWFFTAGLFIIGWIIDIITILLGNRVSFLASL